MGCSLVVLVGFVLLVGLGRLRGCVASFDESYVITWGDDHVSYVDAGRGVQLSMDVASGSGFASKLNYNSGFFHLTIKTPSKDTAGVVTAFYLASGKDKHDELDFEFLGNREGKPITLQTNVFANGHGNREQRIRLWFDPSQDYHDYAILWNPFHVVFFVDDIPIRIFQNKTNIGVDYPSQPMQIIASLWNGEDWATDGGKAKINWAMAPFVAQFQGFSVDGCASDGTNRNQCSSPALWWNAGMYKELSSAQLSAYQNVRNKYMTYDYCSDKSRFPVLPPECSH